VKQRFLKEWHKLTTNLPARHFILAISGGVDSVVLARLLATSKVSFSMAHCNFKLRGTASAKDEEFVKALAAQLGVQIVVESFATESYASENGISIQMAARDLRYQWFEELTKATGSYLVTAHHANDLAETMLFNLTKGTGLAGLQGIPQLDEYRLRPLLWATKEEILAYAHKKKLSWREDKSNSNKKYARNRIRNEVIPQLEAINPAFIEAAQRTARRILDVTDLLDHLIDEQALKRWEGGHLRINKQRLLELPGRVSLLYRIVSDYGFNFDQVEAMISSIDSVGAIFMGNKATLNIDRQDLIVSQSYEGEVAIKVAEDCQDFAFGGKNYQCQKIPIGEYSIKKDATVAAFDYEKLRFPLIVRAFKQGERFQPFGMQGKKLISDYLIDEKVPVNLKIEQAVLESAGKIICLLGRRIDERFKISPSTQTVFEVRPTKR
jgi:tRNA(Ile)-lysidine synthase